MQRSNMWYTAYVNVGLSLGEAMAVEGSVMETQPYLPVARFAPLGTWAASLDRNDLSSPTTCERSEFGLSPPIHNQDLAPFNLVCFLNFKMACMSPKRPR